MVLAFLYALARSAAGGDMLASVREGIKQDYKQLRAGPEIRRAATQAVRAWEAE